MASLEAKANFITTLRVHYNVPIAMTDPNRGQKELAWMASISQCIDPYEDSVLARAGEKILNTRTGDRRFPLPAEIRKVCDAIAVEDKRLPLMQRAKDEAYDPLKASPYSRARTKLVIDLLRGEMGRRASREGWVGQLVDYVREHMTLPDEKLVTALQKKSREFMEVREMCHAGVGWPRGSALPAMFAGLGDTIEARNRLWASVINGQESEEALFRPIKTGDAA